MSAGGWTVFSWLWAGLAVIGALLGMKIAPIVFLVASVIGMATADILKAVERRPPNGGGTGPY